jgi:hypothetical protein
VQLGLFQGGLASPCAGVHFSKTSRRRRVPPRRDGRLSASCVGSGVPYAGLIKYLSRFARRGSIRESLTASICRLLHPRNRTQPQGRIKRRDGASPIRPIRYLRSPSLTHLCHFRFSAEHAQRADCGHPACHAPVYLERLLLGLTAERFSWPPSGEHHFTAPGLHATASCTNLRTETTKGREWEIGPCCSRTQSINRCQKADAQLPPPPNKRHIAFKFSLQRINTWL